MNAEKGWSIQQDQCLFLGTNRRNGCEGGRYDGGGWYGDCKGTVADISRCGEGQADTFQECEKGGHWDGFEESWRGTKWQPGGAKLYNYMVGLPVHHPKYKGEFTMLSHVKGPKPVKVEVPANELCNDCALGDGAGAGGNASSGANPGAGGNTGSREIDLSWLSAAGRQCLPEFLVGIAAVLLVFSVMAVTER
jgi:hypothetical protein